MAVANASATVAIKGEDKTQKAFRSVQKSVGKLKKSLGTLKAGALGLGAMGAGLSLFTKKVLDHADKLGKTAVKINITTGALQKLRFAAEQAGMSSGSLDQMLSKLTVNLGQAAFQTGAQRDALDTLGLSASRIAKLPLEQSFLVIGQALSELTTDTERAKVATDLFGRSGQQMFNLFQNGAAPVIKLGQELENVGGVLSDNLVKNSERANDAVNKLSKATFGASSSLVGEFAPSIEAAANSATEWIKMVKGSRQSLEQMIRGLKPATDSLATLEAAHLRLVSASKKTTEAIKEEEDAWFVDDELIGRMQRWQKVYQAWIPHLAGVIEKRKEDGAATEKNVVAEYRQAVALTATEQAALKQTDTKKKKVKVEKEEKEGIEGVNISMEAQALFASKLTTQFEAHTSVIKKKQAATKEATDAETASLHALQIAHLDVMRDRFAVNEETKFNLMDSDMEETERIIAMYDERKKIHRNHALDTERMQKINAANIVHIETAKQKALAALEEKRRLATFSTMNAMAGAVADQGQAFFEFSKALAIGEAIMNTYNAASAALKIPPPPVGVALAAMITGLGLANVAKISSQKAPTFKKEMGGPVASGRPYLVGERGPEMFVPNSAGAIQSNTGATNVNIQINAVDTEGFDELLFARRAVIVSVINQAMHRQGKRGLV